MYDVRKYILYLSVQIWFSNVKLTRLCNRTGGAGVSNDVILLLKSSPVNGAFPLRLTTTVGKAHDPNGIKRGTPSDGRHTASSIVLATVVDRVFRTRFPSAVILLRRGVGSPAFIAEIVLKTYKWVLQRLGNNMFQCIVQPRNTWSRSSPELRELRVVYPGYCRMFYI